LSRCCGYEWAPFVILARKSRRVLSVRQSQFSKIHMRHWVTTGALSALGLRTLCVVLCVVRRVLSSRSEPPGMSGDSTKQPLAETFDHIYNAQCQHMDSPAGSPPPRPGARPRRPRRHDPSRPRRLLSLPATRPLRQHHDRSGTSVLANTCSRSVATAPSWFIESFANSTPAAPGTQVEVIHDSEKTCFYDTTTGELLLEHPIPEPGVEYISDGT